MATKETAQPSLPEQGEGNSGPMDIGFKGAGDPRLIELGATQDMNQIRFEKGAIRREFGNIELLPTATSKILALGEHGINFPGAGTIPATYTSVPYRIYIDPATKQGVIETFELGVWTEKIRSTKEAIEGAWSFSNGLGTTPVDGEAIFNDDQVTLYISQVDKSGINYAVDMSDLVVGQATIEIDGVTWTIDAKGIVVGNVEVWTLSPGAQRPIAYSDPVNLIIYTNAASPAEILTQDMGPTNFLSAVSIQNVLAVADGVHPIMAWTLTPDGASAIDPFTGALLTEIGDSDDATISLATVASTLYEVDFNIDVSFFSGSVTDITLVMAVLVDGIEVAEQAYSYVLAELPVDVNNTIIPFQEQLDVGQIVTLLLKQIIPGGAPLLSESFVRENVNPNAILSDNYQAPNPNGFPAISPPPAAANGYYRIQFNPVRTPRAGAASTWSLNVGYLDASNSTQPYVVIDTLVFTSDNPGPQDITLQMGVAPVFDTFVRFTINHPSDAPGVDPLDTSRVAFLSIPTVEWLEGSFVIELLGNSVNYSVITDLVSKFQPITPGNFPELEAGFGPQAPVAAPIAKYLGSFGERLFGLWENGDRQILNASSDGNILMWQLSQTGAPAEFYPDDSVNLTLQDTRVDPIDDLEWLVPVSSQVAILGRKRSMMRVFETGNVSLSVGATHWKDGIGSVYPYAINICEGGVMFLGQNRMVYYMTADQVVPVGMDIQEELVKHLYSDTVEQREMIDSMYDSAQQEWILGVPHDGNIVNITHWYIFDVGKFLSPGDQAMVWRRRTVISQRLSAVQQALDNAITIQQSTQIGVPLPYYPDVNQVLSDRTLLFSNPLNEVQAITEEILTFNGASVEAHWESPTLSRGPMGEEATLRTVGFQYACEIDTSFFVDVSGDGGQSYTETLEILTVNTNQQVRRVRQAFNTSGYDLRFRVRFNADTVLKLFSYYPSLVTRGRTVL